MRLLRHYVRSVDALSTWVGFAMAALIPILVLVMLIEVIARYGFNSPTIWAYDTSLFIFGYVGLLSGAYALKAGEHIRVDIFYGTASPRAKAILDLVTAPLIAFFLVLVIVYGGSYALEALSRGARKSTEWGPPMGHLLLMMPVGAGLLLLQATANWVRDIHLLVTGRALET